MTKVDFYLLSDNGQNARELMACKLIDKIYQMNHTVYVHTGSQQDSSRIDDMLWTFKPGNFIPHNLISTNQSPDTPTNTPVLIGHQNEAPTANDVLINLTHEVPLFFSQFNRVAEFVDAEDNNRSLGRTRFKFYKDRGYELDTHNI